MKASASWSATSWNVGLASGVERWLYARSASPVSFQRNSRATSSAAVSDVPLGSSAPGEGVLQFLRRQKGFGRCSATGCRLFGQDETRSFCHRRAQLQGCQSILTVPLIDCSTGVARWVLSNGVVVGSGTAALALGLSRSGRAGLPLRHADLGVVAAVDAVRARRCEILPGVGGGAASALLKQIFSHIRYA
jgi:hypothetical protein